MFNGRVTEQSEDIIASSGFWDDISVGEFQRTRGIPLQIPLELTKQALVYAIFSIELELQEVAQYYCDKGFKKVSEIESNKLEGINFYQFLYKKAVFARAKHELLPEFATLSARELHEKREMVSEQKSLLAEATMAIRALKGKPRGNVMLL